MDDQNIFTAFVTNILGVGTPRVRNEITGFVSTFFDLLSSSESEIDNFVKTTHGANSARAANARTLIPPGVIQGLKSIQFELKDCEMCDSLPDAAALNNLDNAQMRVLRKQRQNAMDHEERRNLTALPDMDVPTLTHNNFDEFNTSFHNVVARQTSQTGASLEYVIRDIEIGNFNAPFSSREEISKSS